MLKITLRTVLNRLRIINVPQQNNTFGGKNILPLNYFITNYLSDKIFRHYVDTKISHRTLSDQK